jgi:hypothetical protein
MDKFENSITASGVNRLSRSHVSDSEDSAEEWGLAEDEYVGEYGKGEDDKRSLDPSALAINYQDLDCLLTTVISCLFMDLE